ncbi:MAG: hypothetical protein ACR2IZ_00040 [Candidatus Nanopelagicus sp.]
MCSMVVCKKCKKPTWSGCGQHIEEALYGVALSDRCQGHAGEEKKSSFLSKLFGR